MKTASTPDLSTELYWDNSLASSVPPFYTPDIRTYILNQGPSNPMYAGCPGNYGGACTV
jgi:hypothetical protein